MFGNLPDHQKQSGMRKTTVFANKDNHHSTDPAIFQRYCLATTKFAELKAIFYIERAILQKISSNGSSKKSSCLY